MRHRRLGRTRAAFGVAAAATLAPLWLLVPPSGAMAKRLERGFHRLIANGFGLKISVRGKPGGPGTLFVANHISWADIVSLAASVDADFVAKSDVAGYPGLGRLARRAGTIFVERDRRAQAGEQMVVIRDQLTGGNRVVLFPEGTTSDGRGVMPFRTSLFAAAGAAARVQPVTITYTARNGDPLPAGILEDIAWIGEEALVTNAAVLSRIRARVSVAFHDPVDPAAFATRKALAEHCRDIINAHYLAFGAPRE